MSQYRRYSHNDNYGTTSYRHHHSHHNNHNDINYDKILWNTSDPSLLISSIPLISSYSSDYNNGFISHLNLIKKLIIWLENESDIFDKSLLNENKFKKICNKFESINNHIKIGLNDCNNLINRNKISYNNYTKYKARLKSINNQYNLINEPIKSTIYKLNKQFQVQKSKQNLLMNHNKKTSYSLSDEKDHLTSSLQIVNDTLEMISNVKTEMLTQSNFLKQTQVKLLKFINLTGFSGSIIRVITQRSKVDFYIFIAGAIITLTVIILLWYYF